MTALAETRPISRPLAIAAMLGSAACWGGATVMSKGALESFGPFTLLAIQLVGSVTVLWLAVWLLRLRPPSFKTALKTGSTGLLEPGLAYAVGVPGLVFTTASNATVIASLEPVFILLLAWLMLGTVIRKLNIPYVFLSLIGVVLVSLARPGVPLDSLFIASETFLGDGLIAVATFFAALYVVISSRLAQTMPAVLLTVLQQTVGLFLVVGLFAVVVLNGWETLPERVSTSMLLLAVVSGLIQYALAFWLYIIGLKGIPAGVAGLFLTTTPIFGILGATFFLGEQITLLQIAGVGLVIFGLCSVLIMEPEF